MSSYFLVVEVVEGSVVDDDDVVVDPTGTVGRVGAVDVVDAGTVLGGGGGCTQGATSSCDDAVSATTTESGCWPGAPHRTRNWAWPRASVIVGLAVSTRQTLVPNSCTLADGTGVPRTTPWASTDCVVTCTTRLVGSFTNGGSGAMDEATARPL